MVEVRAVRIQATRYFGFHISELDLNIISRISHFTLQIPNAVPSFPGFAPHHLRGSNELSAHVASIRRG